MSKTQERPWWEDVSIQSGGDVIVGQVGAGAKGVAIGKNQAVYGGAWTSTRPRTVRVVWSVLLACPPRRAGWRALANHVRPAQR